MRGTHETSGSLFSYVDLEERIPARYPMRKIRQVVNDALASRDAEFEALYRDFGRPSPQTMYRGVERVRSRFILTMVANNLARSPRLLAA